jgi:hypothetical protein
LSVIGLIYLQRSWYSTLISTIELFIRTITIPIIKKIIPTAIKSAIVYLIVGIGWYFFKKANFTHFMNFESLSFGAGNEKPAPSTYWDY